MNRDDRIHGALLILNELVRISSMEGEVRNCLSAGREGPCALGSTDRIISGSSRSCESQGAGSKIVNLGLKSKGRLKVALPKVGPSE